MPKGNICLTGTEWAHGICPFHSFLKNVSFCKIPLKSIQNPSWAAESFPLGLQSTWLPPFLCAHLVLSTVDSCPVHSFRTVLSFPTSLWPPSRQLPHCCALHRHPWERRNQCFHLTTESETSLGHFIAGTASDLRMLDMDRACVPFSLKCGYQVCIHWA